MEYCDWSPCPQLLAALGRYVFGDPKNGTYKLLVRQVGTEPMAVSITYCPFCGTRMDNLQLVSAGQILMLPDAPGS